MFENRAVYKQVWPGSKSNIIYFKQGRYIISSSFGKNLGHNGIESSSTSEKCPTWTDRKDWRSWKGFDSWFQDDYFKITCHNGTVPLVPILS